MNRKEAWERYQEEIKGTLQTYREEMGRHLSGQTEELEQIVADAVDRLREPVLKQRKAPLCYVHFSFLRVDLIRRDYRLLAQGMDERWYLDTEPAETAAKTGQILVPLDQLWDSLTEQSRKYAGYVNAYDICHLIFEEKERIDRSIACLLRWRLRDWKERGLFAGIPFSREWILKWGEYWGDSEMLLHVDWRSKGIDAWKEAVRTAGHKADILVFGFWHKEELERTELKELDLRFSVFDKCSLKGISFDCCNLEGSRFPGSRFEGCSFHGCCLTGADFSGCAFENTSFKGAELTGAIFPAESIPFLHLDPRQLQKVTLKQGDETEQRRLWEKARRGQQDWQRQGERQEQRDWQRQGERQEQPDWQRQVERQNQPEWQGQVE